MARWFFLHCFLYVYAVKIRSSWVEKSGQNNFHTQMWHKYVKLLVFSREEKTKTEKEKSIAWVLLLFPALCRVRLWQFMLLLEFILLMLLVLWQRRRRPIVDVFHTALTECEWVSEWVSVCFCVSVQMTRWYSSRCCFLNLFGHAYIKLCSKHTMNETTFSSFTSHLPSCCFLFILSGVEVKEWETDGKKNPRTEKVTVTTRTTHTHTHKNSHAKEAAIITYTRGVG